MDTRQIKAKLFLTLSSNLYITGSKQFHEESKQSRATLTDIDCSGMHKAGWECTSFE